MIVFFLGIALFTAGLLSFFISNPQESEDLTRLDAEVKRESIFKRLRDFVKNGFRYVNDLITKVILPRLSIEQRSKFYSAIRFYRQLKNFIFSYYYYFICAIALLIIYHQGKKMFKHPSKSKKAQ